MRQKAGGRGDEYHRRLHAGQWLLRAAKTEGRRCLQLGVADGANHHDGYVPHQGNGCQNLGQAVGRGLIVVRRDIGSHRFLCRACDAHHAPLLRLKLLPGDLSNDEESGLSSETRAGAQVGDVTRQAPGVLRSVLHTVRFFLWTEDDGEDRCFLRRRRPI